MIKSWVDLEQRCPINLERIHSYWNEFESYLPIKIRLENLNESKENVLNARSCFDSMVVTLMQLLYDREILEKPEDKILFAWLSDNINRYLKRIDEDEFNLIIKLDEPGEKSLVGISRISAYSKLLRSSADMIIYESLLKATIEYKEFKETAELKKTPRNFIYILFQIIQITLSILGGLAREKSGLTKRGMVQTIPTTWQSLMGSKGQALIRNGYKEDTGVDVLDIEEELDLGENLIKGDLQESEEN